MVARSRGPFYKLSELVKECSVSGMVFVRKTAREDAKKHFGLETQYKIINFIANAVFENLAHDNTDDIKDGPDTGITFDAYIFRIGPKYVYFAFYKRSTGWVIKSFHPPEVGDKTPPLSYSPFTTLERLKQ